MGMHSCWIDEIPRRRPSMSKTTWVIGVLAETAAPEGSAILSDSEGTVEMGPIVCSASASDLSLHVPMIP